MFSIPDEKGRITQPNSGASLGNVYASYGIDFESEKGKIRISNQVKKAYSDEDDVDFGGYAGAIVPYSIDGSTGKIYAISDKSFDTNFTTPTTGWAQSSTSGNDPDGTNNLADAVVFDGLFLVSGSSTSGTQDILAWNGSTWSSWWKTTLGQTGLPTGYRTLMKVGSDGNLYLTSGGNKLFKVHPVDGADVAGAGTLDFSATNYQFTCLAVTSNRLFIGAKDLSGEEGVIIEWDMSPASSTAYRIHKIGAQSVPCIAVWNDTPIAVLTNGKIKYFDGNSFVEYKGVEFPVSAGTRLYDEFIHPNGWDIIDDKPHFLAFGRTSTQTTLTSIQESDWDFPFAVWCLDPEIGLYPRFVIGSGETPQEDYGKPAIKEVGALFAYKTGRQDSTRFLCSYEYYMANLSTVRSVLSYYDNTNSQASHAWLATPFVMSYQKPFKELGVFNKPMLTGCSVKVYYRSEDAEPARLNGNWTSTTQLNALATGLGIEKGDIGYVKLGNGSNQWLKVLSVAESSTVTSVTFETANSFVTAGDGGTIDIFKFKSMGAIDSTTKDYTSLTVPDGTKRKKQFLLEFIQSASQEIELDAVMVQQ